MDNFEWQKKTPQKLRYDNDRFESYTSNSHFVTVTVTLKNRSTKDAENIRIDSIKAAAHLELWKSDLTKVIYEQMGAKTFSVVFHNDHCDVTMTHFSRKQTLCLVSIFMWATILHFKLKKFSRRKPRYGKICFSFSIKVPLPKGSKGLTSLL